MPRSSDVVSEVFDLSVAGRPLNLKAGERLSDHDHNPTGVVRGAVQHSRERRDGFLRLYLHTAHVDQGEVLVWLARQFPVRSIASNGESANIRRFKETRHRDRYEVDHWINGERVAVRHIREIIRKFLPSGFSRLAGPLSTMFGNCSILVTGSE